MVVLVVVLVGLFGIGSVQVQVQVSGSVVLISDYVWCGSLQSDGDLVVQVGVKVLILLGWYVSVWGLNVLFKLDNGVCSEFDLVVGWFGVLVLVWNLDVNLICYVYLGIGCMLDWIEFNIMLIWKQCVWLQVVYFSDVLVGGYCGIYVQLGVCVLLYECVCLEVVVGQYWLVIVQGLDYLYGQFSVIVMLVLVWELCVIVYDIDNVVKCLFLGNVGGCWELVLQGSF